jgi:hypothetical protein
MSLVPMGTFMHPVLLIPELAILVKMGLELGLK